MLLRQDEYADLCVNEINVMSMHCFALMVSNKWLTSCNIFFEFSYATSDVPTCQSTPSYGELKDTSHGKVSPVQKKHALIRKETQLLKTKLRKLISQANRLIKWINTDSAPVIVNNSSHTLFAD